MKHQTSKILSLLLLIIGISLGSMTAKANDYTLSTNDAWQSGSIQTEGQSNFYTVSIPRAGHLTIDLQAWSLESSHWYLLSEDLTFTGIKPVVISEIRSLAARYGIKRILLFGSRARGDYRRDSDIDLAVSGGDIARFRLALEEETSTLLQYDVIDLDSTRSPELLEAISKEGVILHEEI